MEPWNTSCMYIRTSAQSRHSAKRHGCTLPFRDMIQRESPAFATTSLLLRIIATTAVLPEVGPVKSECRPYINHHNLHDNPISGIALAGFDEAQALHWNRSNLMLQSPYFRNEKASTGDPCNHNLSIQITCWHMISGRHILQMQFDVFYSTSMTLEITVTIASKECLVAICRQNVSTCNQLNPCHTC